MIELRSPRSQPGYGAIMLLPEFRLFLRSYQRILSSRHNRNVSASDQFEHAQSVSDFRLEPLIPSDHGDAQDFRLRRLNQQQCRLQVGAGGSGGVLIDDDLAFFLAP